MQRLCTAEPIGGKPPWDPKNLPGPAGARTRAREGGGLTPTLKPGRERERERERDSSGQGKHNVLLHVSSRAYNHLRFVIAVVMELAFT